jgi:hypothetical protein
MAQNNRNRLRLPIISEITEEMLLQLRDYPEEETCPRCKGDKGVLIGKMQAELYSIHYIDTVSVYGCPACFRIWYGSSKELA